MAGFLSSGALLLVVLIGSSFGYPSKMAPAPAPAAPVEVSQPQASAVSVRPIAVSQGTNIPSPPSYATTPLGGFQHASAQDVAWAIQPLSLLSGAGSGAPVAVGDAGGLGYTYGSAPQYHAGDLASYEGSYEHGDSESETHGQGYSSPVSVHAPNDHVYVSESQPSGLGAVSGVGALGGFGAIGGFGGWPGASYLYDYMFMTGQYPPGTLTHSSESYEQGADHFQDVHYQRYYIPSYTITELQPAPVMQAPVKQAPVVQMPVKQMPSKGY